MLNDTENEEIKEDGNVELIIEIDEKKIDYCRYDVVNVIYYLSVADSNNYTIICINLLSYGKSRSLDRQHEVNRCMRNVSFCVELMQGEDPRTAIHIARQGKQLVNGVILLAIAAFIDLRGTRVFRGVTLIKTLNFSEIGNKLVGRLDWHLPIKMRT
ncbi:hypothetical protein LOAG_07272 [Loa loa]|uniref:Uncharacterized protein n=1 Tax=Loa loa TaxID=7209 RepID=A0A1S0TW50_LOALO|nr:hypothetical protein LOAG_07272 [Loa loa]EFO21216.1 hypothetical protein LOAG_07272 [Loa loa]